MKKKMPILPVQLLLMIVIVLNRQTAIGSDMTFDICTSCARTGFRVVTVNASCNTLTIRTPDFGRRNYTNNSNCTLILQSGLDPLVLSLRFRHFDVENSRRCRYDFLCLHGRRFCGSWADGQMLRYILLAQRNFTIFFQTNNIVTRPGFEIIVSTTLARNEYIHHENRINRHNRRRPRLESYCGCSGNSSRGTNSRFPADNDLEYDSEENGGRPEFRSGFLEYYNDEYRYTGSSSDLSSDSSDSDQSRSRRNRRKYKRSIVSAPLSEHTSLEESFTESDQPTILSDEILIANEEIIRPNPNDLINTGDIIVSRYEIIYDFFIDEDATTNSKKTSTTEEYPPTTDETPSTTEEYSQTTNDTPSTTYETLSPNDETPSRSAKDSSVTDKTLSINHEPPSADDETQSSNDETPSAADETPLFNDKTPSENDETAYETHSATKETSSVTKEATSKDGALEFNVVSNIFLRDV